MTIISTDRLMLVSATQRLKKVLFYYFLQKSPCLRLRHNKVLKIILHETIYSHFEEKSDVSIFNIFINRTRFLRTLSVIHNDRLGI